MFLPSVKQLVGGTNIQQMLQQQSRTGFTLGIHNVCLNPRLQTELRDETFWKNDVVQRADEATLQGRKLLWQVTLKSDGCVIPLAEVSSANAFFVIFEAGDVCMRITTDSTC